MLTYINMKTLRFYVQTSINLQSKCLGTPDCKNMGNVIDFIWLNVQAMYLIQTILYHFKWDMALWKWPKCPQYMQWTWWQTVATQHMGLAHWVSFKGLLCVPLKRLYTIFWYFPWCQVWGCVVRSTLNRGCLSGWAGTNTGCHGSCPRLNCERMATMWAQDIHPSGRRTSLTWRRRRRITMIAVIMSRWRY